MRDNLQQLQDAVYVTKANLMRYNNESLKKIQHLSDPQPDVRSQFSSNTSMEPYTSKMQDSSGQLSLTSTSKDSEIPMPPLVLAPSHQQGIRPCEISDVLQDLVGAIKPLALKTWLVLIIIDDDGPDMHYMTQMHSLAPFGADLCAEDRIEDNMTWNFVAGLIVAQEILNSYGSVVRVISPRNTEAFFGAGGTCLEIWLPSFSASSASDAESSSPET